MKRLLVWTGADDAALCERLSRVSDLEVVRAATAQAAAEAMPSVDAMITSVIPWNAALAAALRAAPRLRWLQVLNAGYDNLEALGLPEGLVLSTLGELGSEVIAEHALALLLALFRRLPAAAARARARQWDPPTVRQGMRTLRGARVAVVGYGPIGRELARLLTACGATPVALARRARREQGVEVHAMDELHAVLADVEAVAICAPLKPGTKGLMDAAAFAALRPGAVLVNVSRGAIVDTAALCAALASGRLYGAGLDVTDVEPLPPDHPLWAQPNLVLTPHVAWAGAPASDQLRRLDFVVANAQRFARGETPLNAKD